MPGYKSVHLDECLSGKFIGVDFGISEDISKYLSDDFKLFKDRYRPIFLKNRPDKSKVAAGLACGSIWTVCHNLKKGDIILSPDGKGEYFVGEIDSNYYYAPGEILPHRRKVNWYKTPVRRSDMTEALRNSSGSVLTTCDITKYAQIKNIINKLIDLCHSRPLRMTLGFSSLCQNRPEFPHIYIGKRARPDWFKSSRS